MGTDPARELGSLLEKGDNDDRVSLALCLAPEFSA